MHVTGFKAVGLTYFVREVQRFLEKRVFGEPSAVSCDVTKIPDNQFGHEKNIKDQLGEKKILVQRNR